MHDYIDYLKAQGQLTTVSVSVDPKFELAAVTQKLQELSDNAILFENVQGTEFPVITNVYGSRQRLCNLVGAKEGNFCHRWSELYPSDMTNAVSHEKIADQRIFGKLSDLPLITYFEKDGGPYFTSALFIAKDPKTAVPNLSFHRSQYISDDELRVRLGTTHDLAHYQTQAEELGEPLQAALLIGTPPEFFVAACASLPRDHNELMAAAAIKGSPVPMEDCKTIDLQYPKGTQVVVEGHFLLNEKRPEGPFGEFMGYYVPVGDNAVFQVTSVHWLENPVFHSINCGSPEDMYPLDYAIATRIYTSLQSQLPGVLNVACYPYIMNTVVQIKQQYEGHARHVLLATMGAHLDYSKSCMVVDEDIDINNLEEVLWAYLTRGRADTRAFILEDIPGFYRDPKKDHWGRLAIDATKPFDRQEEFERKRIPGVDTLDIKKYLS